MININRFAPSESFFAAANGFSGFISLFPSVFDPSEYKKIFILKGGPGTGKSTLLKGLISLGCESGYKCTAVYCSSDPHSLDGAIIEHRGGRIAVIDGTAPHTTDPEFPGAVEEIINLGDGFDTGILESRRNDILDLCITKKEAYRAGYRALALAGKMWEYIHSQIKNSEAYLLAEEIAQKITKEFNYPCPITNLRRIYYGSFSKNGYTRLPISKASSRLVNIKGDPFVTNLVMTSVRNFAVQNGVCTTISPSPLDDRIIDIICTADYIISSNGKDSAAIDLSELTVTDVPEYTRLQETYGSFLEMARQHFAVASKAHFELEGLYKDAMDFENNDRIFDKLSKRIGRYVEN